MTNSPSPQAVSLLPCPFCGEALFMRKGVNPYGRCDTEDCWMNARACMVPTDDPAQVTSWNRRASPADGVVVPREPTPEMILAGCRAITRSLFRSGLSGLSTDGPVTRARMAETINSVRLIYAATLAAPPALAATSVGEGPTLVGGAWKNGALSRLDRVKAHRMAFGSDFKAAVEAVDEETERQRIAALSAQPAPAATDEAALWRDHDRRHAPAGGGEAVAWERLRTVGTNLGWVPVDPEDIPHYRSVGQEVRALFATPPSADTDKLLIAREALEAVDESFTKGSSLRKRNAALVKCAQALARLSTTEAGG